MSEPQNYPAPPSAAKGSEPRISRISRIGNFFTPVAFIRVIRAIRGKKSSSMCGFIPILAILLFLGALLWAREQDPFSRKWFTLRTADHGSVKCVAVFPKPLRPRPVIIYAHGAGGTLMNDGNDVRQMAELGLAVVSLEYNQTNETSFAPQFEALLHYVGRQKWADANAIAWAGFSLGANRLFDFALQHPEQQPRLLVQLGGAGLPEGKTNGLSAELRIIPDISNGMELDRGVVFRGIGECCDQSASSA